MDEDESYQSAVAALSPLVSPHLEADAHHHRPWPVARVSCPSTWPKPCNTAPRWIWDNGNEFLYIQPFLCKYPDLVR